VFVYLLKMLFISLFFLVFNLYMCAGPMCPAFLFLNNTQCSFCSIDPPPFSFCRRFSLNYSFIQFLYFFSKSKKNIITIYLFSLFFSVLFFFTFFLFYIQSSIMNCVRMYMRVSVWCGNLEIENYSSFLRAVFRSFLFFFLFQSNDKTMYIMIIILRIYTKCSFQR